MFKDKRLREMFIKIFDLLTSSQYFLHEVFVMMWKMVNKVWVYFLCSLMK